MFKVTWLVCTGLILLSGCATNPSIVSQQSEFDFALLPVPDIALNIEHVSTCVSPVQQVVELDADSPVTVLVHGCDSSAGNFRSLAQLYAFHGQQTVCYNYDDRDSLLESADGLANALDQLSQSMRNDNISVIGHSMGGLVSRKALERRRTKENFLTGKNIKLTTISAPFSGIAAAKHCGTRPLHWLSLGIVPSICWMVTGDNWFEITYASDFIRDPGPLLPTVDKFLKIVTNEENTCRRYNEEGRCIKSDYVFSTDEQYQPIIGAYDNVVSVEVNAGHVEIVGDDDIAPLKLISVLQSNDMLVPTDKNKEAELNMLLRELYTAK